MTQITEPGIHPGFDIEAYHADPCPVPSLSSSIAKVVVNECPKKAWAKHPRLGKKTTPEIHEDKFSIGTACHTLIFERGKGIVPVDAKDWRTIKAKRERDIIISQGHTPILKRHLMLAEKMAGAANDQMSMHELAEPFFGAGDWEVRDEVAIFWTEEIDDQVIWCRSLIDRLCVSKDAIVIFDFKSTETSVAPHDVARHAHNMGYHIQAAMITRGLQKILQRPSADRAKMHYIFAETDEPHLLTVGEVTKQMRVLGLRQVAAAMAIWAKCIATNTWPGYPKISVPLTPPPFVETRWLEREMSDPSIADLPNDAFLVDALLPAKGQPFELDIDNIDPT